MCLICGSRQHGLWRVVGPLRRLLDRGRFTDLITVACVVLYVLSLLVDPAALLRPRGPFDIFSPSGRALDLLGMTGSLALAEGRWWTLLTAIYLHGNLLHILFNVLWIRQLGPAVHEVYGPSRLVVIFTLAGVAGFALSNLIGVGFTVGASGSIFGLLGALVAYGQRRGGAFGAAILREYGLWALVLFVFGFVMAGVNNFAHAGGFLGGLGMGWGLSLAERRRETAADHLVAAALIAATVLAFGLALWTGLAG